jgi:ech hydrogenase subunit B
MGANREMIQMMSYEPMVLLTAVGFYLATGNFDVAAIIKSDIPAIVKIPGCFIGFMFILTIKLRKSPFDISTSHHAHQEIVKGITTEMSGPCLGMVELAEWYEEVFLLGMVGLFFINSNPLSILLAVVVIILAVFFEVLVDNTSARLTWNQMLKASWTVTLIFGGLNILILELL